MALIESTIAAEITGGHWIGDPPEVLARFTFDSRRLEAGSVFVGLKTANRDGGDFLGAAADKGAVAGIVEDYRTGISIPQLVVENSLEALQALARHARSEFRGWVVAITGSYGKTTVKELIGSFFDSTVYRTAGNLNNHIGLPLSVLELSDAVHRGAVLEIGINQTGEMDRLASIAQGTFGLVTAVGPVHLQGLGSVDGVAGEKAGLLRNLPEGAAALFPATLLQYAPFQNLADRLQVTTLVSRRNAEEQTASLQCGYSPICYDWRCDTGSGPSVELLMEAPGGSATFQCPATSPGILSNFALAAAFGILRGVPREDIQNTFSVWKGIDRRGQTLKTNKQVFFIDCYNANPIAMLDSSLGFRDQYASAARFYVLGEMAELGPESEKYHREVGRAIGAQDPQADFLLMGGQSRFYAAGLRESGIPAERIAYATGVEQGREWLRNREGAVFLKGSRAVGLEKLIPGGHD